ncbi:MAG: hypothetical protein AB7F35_00475 [Acetobacteraceae bacterium]
MKAIAIGAAAAILWTGAAIAQTSPSTTGTGTGMGVGGTANTPTTREVPAATVGGDSARGEAADNSAVVTTDRNALVPAAGANSFTEGQARSRLESNGFNNVGNLVKDEDGVWRGQATRDGRQTQVWLDYKGNVGQY